MRGVNRVTLMGNVGNAPELKYTQDGTAVAKFSLATTETYKGRDGEKKEATEWHRCVAWGKLAEIIGEYVAKGSPLYVEGAIKYGKYTDSAGIEKYSTDIKVDEMRLLAGKPDTGNGTPRNNAPQPAKRAPAPAFDSEPFADDIPFITQRGAW